MEGLANSSITTLQKLTIYDEKPWFANERQQSFAKLISFIVRQNQLQVLDLRENDLSQDRLEQAYSINDTNER